MDSFNFPIEAVVMEHRGEARIALRFERQPAFISRIRSIPDARWSATHKCWHVPDTPELRTLFGLAPPLPVVLSDEDIKELVETLRHYMQSRRYSFNSVRTYTEALSVFLRFFRHKHWQELSNEDLIRFNNDYILKKGLSLSYQNQMVNALKLFFSINPQNEMVIETLHRPRREHKLPNVLSKPEVRDILRAVGNIKHRTMLSLIYSCGLRCSELLNLLPQHIDSKRMLLIVKQSKGKKDRVVPLSQKTIEMLREYYLTYRPKKYIFEGQSPGEPYAARSLQLVLKSAVAKAGIEKPVTLHWLRHSYATHLLESGTDLRYIQEILGHNSSRTTEIYTHVSTRSLQNIISPFDSL